MQFDLNTVSQYCSIFSAIVVCISIFTGLMAFFKTQDNRNAFDNFLILMLKTSGNISLVFIVVLVAGLGAYVVRKIIFHFIISFLNTIGINELTITIYKSIVIGTYIFSLPFFLFFFFFIFIKSRNFIRAEFYDE